MLQILPVERWDELKEVFRTEFDAELPHKGKASILAELAENGEIKGFVVVEFLARIGQIYNSGIKTREMLNLINEQIPPGNSVIAISSNPRFDGLCGLFGMREVEGKVFRKDF
jgi:hypothetical protein